MVVILTSEAELLKGCATQKCVHDRGTSMFMQFQPLCNLCCRDHNGKLGKPEHRRGNLKLSSTTAFLAGQSKCTLYTDIHSIISSSQDVPVTLVIQQKDPAAKNRRTSCFVPGSDVTPMADMWADLKEDRPCSEEERFSMLQARMSIEC